MDLRIGNGQARNKSQSVGASSDDQKTSFTGSLDDGRRVLGELKTKDQTATSDLLDQVGELGLELGEALLEDLRLGVNALLKLRLR